jgi:hypothetical protein
MMNDETKQLLWLRIVLVLVIVAETPAERRATVDAPNWDNKMRV